MLGYGRYDDDYEHVGCPRAKSDMTPCIARDGATALAERTGLFPSEDCVGCLHGPNKLLRKLLDATGRIHDKVPGDRHQAADHLRDLVREVTAA